DQTTQVIAPRVKELLRTPCAIFASAVQNCRTSKNRALVKSRSSKLHCRQNFPKIYSTLPTITHCSSATKQNSQVYRTTQNRQRAQRQQKMAKTVISLRCTSLLISRCCNTPITVRCAKKSIAPTRPRHPIKRPIRNGITRKTLSTS